MIDYTADDLDDDALLELMRKRREQSDLQQQSITSGNPLGRIIAGVAGGVEAGMTGRSGAEGAMKGMDFVDQNQRRIAALQADNDTKEMSNLVQIARIRADKQRRTDQAQAEMAKLIEDRRYRASEKAEERAYNERMLPVKEGLALKRMLTIAQANGASRQQLDNIANQFKAEQQSREFDFKAGQSGAERAQRAAEKAAEDARRRDEVSAITDRLTKIEGMRQGGATERAGISAKAKAAPSAKIAPKGTDEFKALPKDAQIRVEEMTKLSVKKEKGIGELEAAIGQLDDPSLPEDQKVMIGQMLLKKLNDPEFSDAVGAEEVKRLGSYLSYFDIQRPGSIVGRDIPRFTSQVKNKLTQIRKSKQAMDSQIDSIYGRKSTSSDQQNMRDIERKAAPTGPSKDAVIKELKRRGLVK